MFHSNLVIVTLALVVVFRVYECAPLLLVFASAVVLGVALRSTPDDDA